MRLPASVGEHRIAGSLLVIGFLFLVLAALLYGFAAGLRVLLSTAAPTRCGSSFESHALQNCRLVTRPSA